MASQEDSSALIAKGLEGVRSLRLYWIDVSGIRRLRALRVPTDATARASFVRSLDREGLGITKVCMTLPCQGDLCLEGTGFSGTGEVRLHPDWSTLRRLPWRPTHAMVQNVFREADGSPWMCCPRTALSRAVEALEKFGLRLQCGFESEFCLYSVNSRGERVPVDEAVYCQETAFENMADILDEMTSCLEEMGCGIVQFHPESAPGQMEIVTRHYDAMVAVDRLIETRATICGVAAKHNLRATFLPKLRNDACGSGAHCHFSLVDTSTGKNLFESIGKLSASSKPEFPPKVERFIAGVLQTMPALVMLTVPSSNSFRRLAPGCWAGCFTSWGIQNRETPLRLTLMPGAEKGSLASTNMEFKLFDGTAQPHVGVAGLISAGIYGLEKSLKLPDPIQIDPKDLSPEEAKASGVVQLPTCVSDALKILPTVPGYATISKILGGTILQALTVVRKAEDDFFAGKTMEEEIDILINRY